MLGERGAQHGLFEADVMYLKYVGPNTFYGFLAAQRGKLFQDEHFSKLYCLDNGRPSVPPSDRVSTRFQNSASSSSSSV